MEIDLLLWLLNCGHPCPCILTLQIAGAAFAAAETNQFYIFTLLFFSIFTFLHLRFRSINVMKNACNLIAVAKRGKLGKKQLISEANERSMIKANMKTEMRD